MGFSYGGGVYYEFMRALVMGPVTWVNLGVLEILTGVKV